MDIASLGLDKGNWVATNRGNLPATSSDINCKLVIVALVAQRSDLVEPGVVRVVQAHGGTDSLELRVELDQLIGTVGL
jgi:hypothetical protein